MITGSCLCGAVRYEAAPGGPTYNCHCSNCRKWSGSAFASSMRTPLETLSVVQGDDEVTRYELSPGVMRCFCRRCGSSLFTERRDRDVAHIRLGGVDGDPGVRPQFHAFVASQAPWWEITDDKPRIEGSSFGYTPPAPS